MGHAYFSCWCLTASSCTCGHLPFHLGLCWSRGTSAGTSPLALTCSRPLVFSHGSGFQERQKGKPQCTFQAVACFTLDNVHWPKQVLWPASIVCEGTHTEGEGGGHLQLFLRPTTVVLLSLDPAWEPCPAHTHFTAPCICHPHFTECAPGPREEGVARVPQQPGQKLSWFQPTTLSHLPGPVRGSAGSGDEDVPRRSQTRSPNKDILKQRHGRIPVPAPRHWPPEHPLQPLLPAAWPRPGPPAASCCLPPGPAQEQGGCFCGVQGCFKVFCNFTTFKHEEVRSAIVEKTQSPVFGGKLPSSPVSRRPQFCSVRPAWLACAVPPGPACLEDPGCALLHTHCLSASHACFCLACTGLSVRVCGSRKICTRMGRPVHGWP